MAVFLTKSVFLHIPKCGGNWVKQVLKDNDLVRQEVLTDGHTRHESLEGRIASGHNVPTHYGKFNKRSKERRVFTFVRHPLSWYASYWNWKSNAFKWTDSNEFDRKCKSSDFHEFIENVLDNYDGYLTEMYYTFTSHCGMIGKIESIGEDLKIILKHYNESFNYKTLGRLPANTGRYKVKYTKSLADRIMDSEKLVVNRFGYNYLIDELVSI